MDIDEEIQTDDENSFINTGVMSDIHEDDDADQPMNSEEEQQLIENFDSPEQSTDTPSLSNVADEIDTNNAVSQLSSPSVIGGNYDDDFHTENTLLNKKENEGDSTEKYHKIEDIQMESSNMSIKLDDDSTRMSTNMKESIENPSSDISMSSEREIHSPQIDNEMTEIKLDNVKEIVFNESTKDNLILNSNISNAQLHNPKISQIEEKVEISLVEKNITPERDCQQQIKNNSLCSKSNYEMVQEENCGENLSNFESINDRERMIGDKDLYLSTEKQMREGKDINDLNDDYVDHKENENHCVIENRLNLFQHSEVKVTTNDENSDKVSIDENSSVLRKKEDDNSCVNSQEKEQTCVREKAEIITQISYESEALQNENCDRGGVNEKEDSVTEKSDVQEDEKNQSIPIFKNGIFDNVTTSPVPENVSLQINPVVEGDACNNDELQGKNHINNNENQSAEVLLSNSSKDKDNLLDSQSSVIKNSDKENLNNKIIDFVEGSKNFDLVNEKKDSLQSQGSDEVCTAKGNNEYSDNLTQGALQLMMEEEIMDSECSNDSDNFIEIVKEVSSKVSDKNSDTINELSDVAINNKVAKEACSEKCINETNEISMADETKIEVQEGKDLTEEKKESEVAMEIMDSECSHDSDDFIKVVKEVSSKVSDKFSDNCINELTEVAMDNKVPKEAEFSEEYINDTNEKIEVKEVKDLTEEQNESEIAMDDKVVKDAECIIETTEMTFKDEIKIEVKELDNEPEGQNKGLIDELKINSKDLNECSAEFIDEAKSIAMEEKVAKDINILDDHLDDLTEGLKRIVTEEETNDSEDFTDVVEEKNSRGSDKYSDDCIFQLSEVAMDEKVDKEVEYVETNGMTLKDEPKNEVQEVNNLNEEENKCEVVVDKKVSKVAEYTEECINETNEMPMEDEAQKELKDLNNLTEIKDKSLIDELKNDSKVLNDCSDNLSDVTKNSGIDEKINKDISVSDEHLDTLTEGLKRIATEEMTKISDSKPCESDITKNEHKKITDNDSDSDSNSYIDISEYLINLNKKDYINTPDLISDDSLSDQFEEKDNEKEITIEKSLAEAVLKSKENNQSIVNDGNKYVNTETSGKYDNTSETHEIDRKVIETDDHSIKLKEVADNSDILELTSENESLFEVIDEVGEDEKRRKRRQITTEGLAKSSSKSIFNEELGMDINEGSFTRVVIIGDSFISHLIKMWPDNSKVKPYYIYKDKITISQISRSKIENHAYLKDSKKIFVLFICGLHEITFYSTYKFKSCRGTHKPIKFVRNLESDSQAINRYLNSMSTLKEKLETNVGVSVAFSYLPVIDIKHICNELYMFSRSTNSECSCKYSLGTKAKVECMNSLLNINWSIFYRHLNETKFNSIFEFCPLNITFYLDRWCFYSKKLKLKDNTDALTLSSLLDQVHCLDADVKQNNKSDNIAYLPATFFNRTDTHRILIIGDTWLKFVAENWDTTLNVKPYFYCKNGLTFSCIQKVITSLSRTGVKLLIITSIPSGEFLTASKFSECKDHDSLEYLVPNQLVVKDPTSYAEYVIKKLDLLSLNTHSNKLCKIVFLTCYPAFFKFYFKTVYEKHAKNYSSHENSKSLEDLHDSSDFDVRIENCFKKINKHVVILNKELGIPTCNIFSLMYKLSTKDVSIFPTEEKSSENIQKKMLELLEKYTCSFNNDFLFEDRDKTKKSTGTISEFLKNTDICVKIENKAADDKDSTTGSVEGRISSERQIIVLKKKEISPRLNENVNSSLLESKKKYSEELFSKSTNRKRDDFYKIESHFPKQPQSDNREGSNHNYTDYSSKYPTNYRDDRFSYSNRSESYSKYPRDTLRRKGRNNTRSRSRERRNRRSRSKDRSENRKRYSKSRSIERTHNRRSRDRKSSRNKRSRSRTPAKKYNRSRSRSPFRKHCRSKERDSSRNRNHKSRSRSKSQNRLSYNLESSRELSYIEKEAVANLWEVHLRECEMYRSEPVNHPDHDRVKRMWLDIMNSQGLNTFDPSVLQCWWEYWLKKMEELFEVSWEEKKKNCLSLLSSKNKAYDSSDDSSSSSDYESRSRDKHSKRKKKSKNKRSKSEKKSRKHSPPNLEYTDKSPSDLPTSVEEMERLLQEFVKNNKRNKDRESVSYKSNIVEKVSVKPVVKNNASKESEKLLDVISILCQISDKFGALGMSLNVLHQKALECVKNDLNPINCIDDDSKMLLDLISDKIRKILDHSDMSFVQRAIVQEAHDRLVPFLESFEKKPKGSSVDIETLAKATVGLQASEVIDVIKADLASKGHRNISNEELMDLYLKIKAYQMKIVDEKKIKNKHNLLQSDFSNPSTSRDSTQINPYSQLSSLGSYGINTMKDTYGIEDPVAFKKERIKREFMALPMQEKITKFSMFHFLPFEEKSFLMSHLDELEETDPGLCNSLRMIIARRK